MLSEQTISFFPDAQLVSDSRTKPPSRTGPMSCTPIHSPIIPPYTRRKSVLGSPQLVCSALPRPS